MNPFLSQIIYLDNNATTKISPEILDAMMPFLTEKYGNPSSMHFFGGEIGKYLDTARKKISDTFQCFSKNIVFTSGGTESNNLAIFGALEFLEKKCNHIITTSVEHPAVLNTISYFKKKGYRITKLKVNEEGLLDLDELKKNISDKTALVSIMYANNETGVLNPIEEIGKIVKKYNAIFHTDAVQAVGKIPINLKKSSIDLLSFAGHKIHGPKGIGGLYIKNGIKINSIQKGGPQENGVRPGTEAMQNIIGLAKAIKLANKNIEKKNIEIKRKRDFLENWILENIPNTKLNGHPKFRLSNTSNIGFKNIEGESILLHLSKKNICASSGSACSSGSLDPSHVLQSMSIPFDYIHGSIRFSLSSYTTDQEIDYTIKNLPPIIKKLREISPFS